jgi:hypothetical protein
MKMRRENDAKRVAKSVRTHEATMAALAPAGRKSATPKSVTKVHPLYDQEKDK